MSNSHPTPAPLWPAITAGLLFLGAFSLVALWVPTAQEAAGAWAQRIFYFHLASAWTAFAGFFTSFLLAVLFLWRREDWCHHLSVSSAEVGFLFATGVLASGPIWARPVWGTWWTWEPRLTSFAILWFAYAAFLLLPTLVEDRTKLAPIQSVYSILAFLNVPIVIYATRLLPAEKQNHPVSVTLEPKMVATLVASFVAFTFLFVLFLTMRFRLAELNERIARLLEKERH